MTKYLCLIALIISFPLFAEENSFERELQMLENQQERQDEMRMDRAEMITDSVSTANAGVMKEEDNLEVKVFETEQSEIKITPPTVKTRRVRSR